MSKYFTLKIETGDSFLFKISLFDLKVIGSDETRRKLVVKILTLRAEKLFPRKF